MSSAFDTLDHNVLMHTIFLHLPLLSSTLPAPPISLDNTSLPYYLHVRNIGFLLDTTLSLDSHLIHMHKSIHYHLHCLRLIRRSISLHIAITTTSSPYSNIATPYSLISLHTNSSNYSDSKTL